jgi:antibiotic biosynthesis monooxygenase (ABM) superfamily enzyme
MSDNPKAPGAIAPPGRHQLALMIWLAVFPTLTALNLALGDQLESMAPVLRTFVLATIAVPVVIYGLMPHLHRARGHLLSRRARAMNARVTQPRGSTGPAERG